MLEFSYENLFLLWGKYIGIFWFYGYGNSKICKSDQVSKMWETGKMAI